MVENPQVGAASHVLNCVLRKYPIISREGQVLTSSSLPLLELLMPPSCRQSGTHFLVKRGQNRLHQQTELITV